MDPRSNMATTDAMRESRRDGIRSLLWIVVPLVLLVVVGWFFQRPRRDTRLECARFYASTLRGGGVRPSEQAWYDENCLPSHRGFRVVPVPSRAETGHTDRGR